MSRKSLNTPALAIEFRPSRLRRAGTLILLFAGTISCGHAALQWWPAAAAFIPFSFAMRGLWPDPMAGQRLSWRAGQWWLARAGGEEALKLEPPPVIVGRIVVLNYRRGYSRRGATLVIFGDACTDQEQRQLRRLLGVQG